MTDGATAGADLGSTVADFATVDCAGAAVGFAPDASRAAVKRPIAEIKRSN